MQKFDFDNAAGSYDDFYSNPIGQQIDLIEKSIISQYLRRLNCQILVELGCGTGHWTSFFSSEGFTVIGLDISIKMLETANKKNIPGSVFLKQDVHLLPFLDNSIENIASITAIEFVEDQEKVFSEIKRVLKPGGAFIIGCLNINSQLGKTKSENELFRNADFFSSDSLNIHLCKFGKPEIRGCVYLNEKNEILDYQSGEEQLLKYGAFLAGIVYKEK